MSALYIVTNNEHTSETDRSKARAELAQLEQALTLIDQVYELADSGTSTVEIDTMSPLWKIYSLTRAWRIENKEVMK